MTRATARLIILAFTLLSLPCTAETPKIIAFGDSTTAFRPGAVEEVYSVRLQKIL